MLANIQIFVLDSLLGSIPKTVMGYRGGSHYTVVLNKKSRGVNKLQKILGEIEVVVVVRSQENKCPSAPIHSQPACSLVKTADL